MSIDLYDEYITEIAVVQSNDLRHHTENTATKKLFSVIVVVVVVVWLKVFWELICVRHSTITFPNGVWVNQMMTVCVCDRCLWLCVCLNVSYWWRAAIRNAKKSSSEHNNLSCKQLFSVCYYAIASVFVLLLFIILYTCLSSYTQRTRVRRAHPYRYTAHVPHNTRNSASVKTMCARVALRFYFYIFLTHYS